MLGGVQDGSGIIPVTPHRGHRILVLVMQLSQVLLESLGHVHSGSNMFLLDYNAASGILLALCLS